MASYLQGKFKPKNPKKYKGDVNNICYRSSWEFKYMMKLDSDPMVVEWASEEIFVYYTHPISGRLSRYFPDFYVKQKNGDAYLIEIKPKHQATLMSKAKKNSKKFITEASTVAVNHAKWEAAKRFCKDKGLKFWVLTEDNLFNKVDK
jgi:hypothetical protein